jgi:pimeloyl-ACP methyl ester carboxylesterase
MSAVAAILLATAAAPAAAIREKVDEAGGYRLYLPELGEGKKAALLMWLHPAGAEANQLITPWQPQLAELGYALMVPQFKTPNWQGKHVDRVIELADHAIKKHPIDASKIVLLGYSAGGQVACAVAMKHPKRVAGVVTMSGLPTVALRDRRPLMPEKEFKDAVAYFWLVGEEEWQLESLSKGAQMEMVAAGFSVRLRIVSKAGHAFHDSERQVVLDWLKTVRAGKRPEHGLPREQIIAYRREKEHRAELFNAVAQSLGKPFELEWKPAGEIDLGGPVKLMLPKGWTTGAPRGLNGKSRAVPIQPPGEEHIVLFLGYSVRETGWVEHYRKWFANLRKNNAVVLGKSGWITVGGARWHMLTCTFVPRNQFTEPLAKRALLVAVRPFNEKGTVWRSVTMMCPTLQAGKSELRELIRGLLERSELGSEPKPAAGGAVKPKPDTK